MQRFIKSLLVIGLLATGLLAPSHVQAQDARVWSIGPEVGVNFSKYSGDVGKNDFKLGVVTGVFATYSVVSSFGITGKALLSQKGAKSIVNGVENKQTLNYLEVPILGRFFLNSEGKFRPNLFLGPSFGFLFGGTNKVGDADAEKIRNYKDFFNTFDLGATAGLGLNFAVANETRILLDARYTYGFSDVSKTAAGKQQNQAINVSAGISFGF